MLSLLLGIDPERSRGIICNYVGALRELNGEPLKWDGPAAVSSPFFRLTGRRKPFCNECHCAAFWHGKTAERARESENLPTYRATPELASIYGFLVNQGTSPASF